MKTTIKSSIHSACHSFVRVACAGAVLLIASSSQAQILFEADYGSGNIYEFTPGGARSTFASGLAKPVGLALNSAGNLFETDWSSGNVYEFTPGGTRSTFASGLFQPLGLTFDSAGNLFVGDNGGNIYEFTPGGARSIFASGLSGPVGLAFRPVPEPSALGLLAGGATALFVRRRRR
jgi:glucose/arabinose dehydrogenase